MELNKLTSDDRKILATGKLLAYCDDKIIIEPPCHAESIFNMFYSFMHTGFSKNGETTLLFKDKYKTFTRLFNIWSSDGNISFSIEDCPTSL